MVEQHGILKGLLTVKDIMRFMHTLDKDNPSPAAVSLRAASAETWDDYRGSLRTLLEDIWEWTSLQLDNTIHWVKGRTGIAMRLPTTSRSRT